MTSIFRIVISAIVIVATFYFIYWVPLAFIPIPWGIAAVISYAGAMAAGWYAWTRTASVNVTDAERRLLGHGGRRDRLHRRLLRADDLRPGANQGPLLGIFITGPGRRADRRHRRTGALAGAAEAERYPVPQRDLMLGWIEQVRAAGGRTARWTIARPGAGERQGRCRDGPAPRQPAAADAAARRRHRLHPAQRAGADLRVCPAPLGAGDRRRREG